MKPCKLCEKKRYANQSFCFLHWKAREKAKREEKARKKDERQRGTKKYEESQRKMLIKKLDIVFSKVIRSTDKCLYCGKTSAQAQLHCSHVYSRKNLSVRWDTTNAKTLCSYHHRRFWHEQPAEAWAWLTGVWGEEHMAELKLRANAVRIWQIPELKQLLEDLTTRLSNLNSQ